MADLVITAANVLSDVNANSQTGTAGVAITAGMVLYKHAADGKMYAADANLGLEQATNGLGIALHAAAIGQPIRYQTSGDIAIGAVVVIGGVYVLSATDNVGAIAPAADLAAGWYPMIIGIARTAGILSLILQTQSTPVAHA